MLVLARWGAEAAADIALADPVPGGDEPSHRLDRDQQRLLERVEATGEPARSGVEMDGVDREVVAGGRGGRVIQPPPAGFELCRPVAGGLGMGGVAGARTRGDGQGARPSWRPPPRPPPPGG